MTILTHGSLFARLGGFDLGLALAGWRTLWQVESDPYLRRVLARHWPDVERHADMRAVGAGNLAPVDLVTGSFPCQDLSAARKGERAGMDGRASGEFYELARIVGELRPRWVVVENVPGLLSCHGGADLDAVVGALAELGYGVAWRTLDSRHFGVPQRRRRVFVVGRLGGPVPPQVLFDLARTLTAKRRSDARSETLVIDGPDGPRPVAYADRVRADTGLPRRVEPLPRAEPGADDCCPDGPRYAGLGRAVTVPVVRWLGERLLLAHGELYG
jgi:DNA (cytosine-5)-methyltransferase 1